MTDDPEYELTSYTRPPANWTLLFIVAGLLLFLNLAFVFLT